MIRRANAHWIIVAVAAAILVAHSLLYNFVTDDAYISFVYSRNFAEHGELAFNLGDPVEGYTNFLWTVILGAIMFAGGSPELWSRVLGTACAVITLVIVTRTLERALGRKTPWCALPAVLLASSSGFACWSSGGLETQLFTVLVTAALDAVVAAVTTPRALRRAGWLLALAAMTRPEGPLIAAVLGVTWVVHIAIAWRSLVARKRPFLDEVIAAIWFLALWGPWFVWRYRYYGFAFPNTYYVKSSGDWTNPDFAGQMRDHGFYYIWVWLKQTRLGFVLPLALIGMAALRPRTPRFVLGLGCALLALVYVPYAISVGGDFMGLHRFIMPLFVVAAIAVVLGLEWVVTTLRDRMTIGGWVALAMLAVALAVIALELVARVAPPLRAAIPYLAPVVLAVPLVLAISPRALGPLAVAVLVLGSALTQLELTQRSLDPKNLGADRGVIDTPAYLIVYTEDRAKIGRAMAPCFRPDDFSIVGGAGAQPYYARMRGIDVFGLVSRRIAHEEPRQRPRAGHTKWGSDKLLAEFDPAFVFSCYKLHRTAAQPQLTCAGPWKARGYEQVTMRIPGLLEQGEYYTFLAKKARNFQCPGRVH
jgi:arabinofuranosyltransferase